MDAELPAERHSIIPIACLRLSRMRLKATDSAEISAGAKNCRELLLRDAGSLAHLVPAR